jgi:cyclic pyranopterin phosphate synthase
MQLTDQYNRKINYLRISVTDRCDLRCVYCMHEKMTFLPKKEVLTLEEIERLCDNFIDLGINKIRLTGGEPLVRKDLIKLIEKLNIKKKYTNLNEITLTTNGTLLDIFAKDLKKNGVDRINVSLDTIDDNLYKKITRFGNLNNVTKGINEAKKNDIKIKINVVAIKDFNEKELHTMVEWANQIKVDLTFIEVMPMSETDSERHLQFLPLDKVYEKLNSKYNFYKIDKNTGGPSIYYRSNKLLIDVGFITPLTNNFCSSCNRVRITSTGKLFMCLGQNNFVDFKKILRSDYSENYIKDRIKFALKIKPQRHDFIIEKNIKPYLKRHMNVTGG